MNSQAEAIIINAYNTFCENNNLNPDDDATMETFGAKLGNLLTNLALGVDGVSILLSMLHKEQN